jgi:hypothetical protein
LDFLGQLDNDDKASLASAEATSGAAAGGGLAALLALFCSLFVLYRRRTERDKQGMDEFDLPIEHSDEEKADDEEESIFDLQKDEDPSNSDDTPDCDRWDPGRIRGQGRLPMDFDGEESF